MNIIKQVNVPFEVGEGSFLLECSGVKPTANIIKVKVNAFDVSMLDVIVCVNSPNTFWRGSTNRSLEVRYTVVQLDEEFNGISEQVVPFSWNGHVDSKQMFFVVNEVIVI